MECPWGKEDNFDLNDFLKNGDDDDIQKLFHYIETHSFYLSDLSIYMDEYDDTYDHQYIRFFNKLDHRHYFGKVTIDGIAGDSFTRHLENIRANTLHFYDGFLAPNFKIPHVKQITGSVTLTMGNGVLDIFDVLIDSGVKHIDVRVNYSTVTPRHIQKAKEKNVTFGYKLLANTSTDDITIVVPRRQWDTVKNLLGEIFHLRPT